VVPGDGFYPLAVPLRRIDFVAIPLIVIDTNVMRASLYSQYGASFKLISNCGKGQFEVALSVPICFEYEEVLARCTDVPEHAKSKLMEFIVSIAVRQNIFFRWRALSPDPKDDMFLELAIHARASAIVTFNKRDFVAAEAIGIQALTPLEFLKKIGVLS
jgi:putative PIN family toxin of toxin-antitoxin system